MRHYTPEEIKLQQAAARDLNDNEEIPKLHVRERWLCGKIKDEIDYATIYFDSAEQRTPLKVDGLTPFKKLVNELIEVRERKSQIAEEILRKHYPEMAGKEENRIYHWTMGFMDDDSITVVHSMVLAVLGEKGRYTKEELDIMDKIKAETPEPVFVGSPIEKHCQLVNYRKLLDEKFKAITV